MTSLLFVTVWAAFWLIVLSMQIDRLENRVEDLEQPTPVASSWSATPAPE